MRQHRVGGVGAGDSDTLAFQGRDDLGCPGGVACCLGPCFLSLASILALPARFRSAGVGQAAMTSKTASCSSQGPTTASRAGWIWVYRPRIRFAVWLTWRARSRSKPVSMLSAAASSSEVVTALRVWGMVLAAPAMTAASLASVLALPGVRSAMRRIDSPGR